MTDQDNNTDSDFVPKKCCTKCLLEFPATPEFWYKSKNGKYGLSSPCKLCRKMYKRAPPRVYLLNTDPSVTKFCTKCEIELPATEEFWPKNKKHKNGLGSPCKNCKKQYKQPIYAENTDATVHKKCSRCGNSFPAITKFWGKDKHSKYGQKSECKVCSKIRYDTWLSNNPSYNKQYYDANKDGLKREYRSKNINNIRDGLRAYAKTVGGRETIHTTHARREARKRHLISDFTTEQWRRALAYFSYKCAYCNQPLKLGQTMAQDHFIPLSNGGGTTTTNIIPACNSGFGSIIPGCNTLKSNIDPVIWATTTFGAKKGKAIIARIMAYFEWVKDQDK